MLNKTPESMKPDFNKEVKKRRNVFSYETKPIAVAGRECLVLCNQIAANMSKMYKYQLGQEICKEGSDLVECIYLALDEMGYSEKKENEIEKITNKLIRLIVVIRVAKDIGQVNQFLFEKIINKIMSIKIQTENWLNFIKRENEKIKQEGK